MPSALLRSLEHTAAIGTLLADLLQPGDLVLLDGEVGAGKTTFVRATAEALGVREPVRSPTYTVAQVYELADGRSLAHLDLYRDQAPLDAAAFADIEPCFDATWAMVEWPGSGRAWLADRPAWQLDLAIVDARTRSLSIAAPDPSRQHALADRMARLELVP